MARLTEKQANRLAELEQLEEYGNLTNGERIRLRELRDLVKVREHIDQVSQGPELTVGFDGSASAHTHSFVTSTPRQAGKGHQSMIDDLVKVAAFDIARQQYRMPDGTVLTADQLANMNKTQLLHQVYLNQQALGQRAPAPAPTNPWVMPSDEYHVTKGTIVRWKSKKLFTYVAVWVPAHWYITGSGVYYGGNTFTHDDFLNRVIGDAEVTDLELVTELEPLVLGP